MTGFEPRTSGIGSDRSTNWATTTARLQIFERSITSFEYKQVEPKHLSTFKTWSIDCFDFEQQISCERSKIVQKVNHFGNNLKLHQKSIFSCNHK